MTYANVNMLDDKVCLGLQLWDEGGNVRIASKLAIHFISDGTEQLVGGGSGLGAPDAHKVEAGQRKL